MILEEHLKQAFHYSFQIENFLIFVDFRPVLFCIRESELHANEEGIQHFYMIFEEHVKQAFQNSFQIENTCIAPWLWPTYRQNGNF